jgi:hypothetical protein
MTIPSTIRKTKTETTMIAIVLEYQFLELVELFSAFLTLFSAL